MLSTPEFLRYQRQIILPDVCYDGQKKLKSTRVLIVGMGGLGCPVSLYLANSGIGKLGILDHDTVELSNLPRQILYTDEDIGKLKVESAYKFLQKQNPHVKIKHFNLKLNNNLQTDFFNDYDIIIDCTDNFKTRYLINQLCQDYQKTLVTAAIHQHKGQIITLPFSKENPCYRCIFEDIDTQKIGNCSTNGVLATSVGMVALTQAQAAINFLLQPHTEPSFHIIDIRNFKLNSYRVIKNNHCTVCTK